MKFVGFAGGFGGVGSAVVTGGIQTTEIATPPLDYSWFKSDFNLGKTLALGGIDVGAGIRAGHWKVFLTAEVGFCPWSAVLENTGLYEFATTIQSQGFFWGGGIRVGYAIQNTVTPYVQLGMRQKQFSVQTISDQNTDFRDEAKKNLTALSVGLGLSWSLLPCFDLGVRGTADFYKAHAADLYYQTEILVDHQAIHYKPKEVQVSAHMTWSFS